MSLVACLGRRTLTGMLSTSGQQFEDWAAAYRLFERERMDVEPLWSAVRRAVLAELRDGEPVVAAIDDTLVHKRGKRVEGASWRRDPMGPPFGVNLVWAQRFVQTAVAIPEGEGASRSRMAPICFEHAPTAKRPGRRGSIEEWAEYRREQERLRVSIVGARRIAAIRAELDREEGGSGRELVVAVDGAYTNNTVFRSIPERTILIGRVRKDAKLYAPPEMDELPAGRGRPRVYGVPLPTPEEIRADESIAWQSVEAYGAGKVHSFQVKSIGPVRWKGAGSQDLRLVVIRPLSYRPSVGSKLLYRQPCYLVSSDPSLSLERILQAYLWRWEVEVTFREEKTLIGLGEAQVRTERAAVQVPVFAAAVYAYLHLAALRAGIRAPVLPRPKWQRPRHGERCTTGQLLSLFRTELWGRALGVNIKRFIAHTHATTNPLKIATSPAAAVIYSQK